MVVTIVGAGAIGGVTGASLTRAGHDVLLVDQAADHVAAMNENGLAIATPDGDWTAPVRAVTPDGLPATLDLAAGQVVGVGAVDVRQIVVSQLRGSTLDAPRSPGSTVCHSAPE